MSKKTDTIWIDEVDSTNEYVRRHIHELDNLSVVAARRQTNGRGQGDHLWHSEPDKNLTFSVALKNPNIKAREQQTISQAAACSVVRLLDRHGIKARIKKPNDIYVDDKKICGILIENSLMADHINRSIVGIGLNVLQEDFPEELPNPISMILCCRKVYDIQELLNEFMDIFMAFIDRFDSQCFRRSLEMEYTSLLR